MKVFGRGGMGAWGREERGFCRKPSHPFPHISILLPQRQSGRAAAVDAGTGEYAGTAVGAFQWRGRAGISGIKAERAGAAAGGFFFAGTTGQRAPQTRGHGQAGHQREQDGLRTNPAAPEPFARDKLDGEHSNHGQKRHGKEEEMLQNGVDCFGGERSGGGQKAKGQAAGQGKLVEQRKAEQGHKRQPDKRDHGPGPKSVLKRFLGTSASDGVYEFGQEPERAEP